jgi:hypothetical protein
MGIPTHLKSYTYLNKTAKKNLFAQNASLPAQSRNQEFHIRQSGLFRGSVSTYEAFVDK